MTPIVLASTSPYRAELLGRLGIEFSQIDPAVEERRNPDESPAVCAERLATEKALAGLEQQPDAIVIGSDQVYELNGQALGKPLSVERARRQLTMSSTQEAVFHTAVCVASAAGKQVENVQTWVRFRDLDDDTIARYIEREPALDCAGGFRSECLGISLFEWLRSDDPTALIGLPLITVRRLLGEFDISCP